jgi:hypothetical protein
MGLSGRLMDKKVSVSQFLRAAPGARPRSRPKAKAAPSPPPPPRPRPAPAAPSGPPKDWRALAGGRPVPWWLYGTILFATTILAIAGVNKQNNVPTPAPPRHYDVPQSQGPAAWSDTPPSPAPDHTPVKDFRDQFESERRNAETITAVAWSPPSQQFGFTISNANPFPIKDVDIACRLAAPSGTEMGDAVVTVYEIVPANTQKYVRVLVNEFLEINTYRLSPSLQRMISSI